MIGISEIDNRENTFVLWYFLMRDERDSKSRDMNIFQCEEKYKDGPRAISRLLLKG